MYSPLLIVLQHDIAIKSISLLAKKSRMTNYQSSAKHSYHMYMSGHNAGALII